MGYWSYTSNDNARGGCCGGSGGGCSHGTGSGIKIAIYILL